jgi:hypothetical protein
LLLLRQLQLAQKTRFGGFFAFSGQGLPPQKRELSPHFACKSLSPPHKLLKIW